MSSLVYQLTIFAGIFMLSTAVLELYVAVSNPSTLNSAEVECSIDLMLTCPERLIVIIYVDDTIYTRIFDNEENCQAKFIQINDIEKCYLFNNKVYFEFEFSTAKLAYLLSICFGIIGFLILIFGIKFKKNTTPLEDPEAPSTTTKLPPPRYSTLYPYGN